MNASKEFQWENDMRRSIVVLFFIQACVLLCLVTNSEVIESHTASLNSINKSIDILGTNLTPKLNERVLDSCVLIQCDKNYGSGSAIRKNLILTAGHIVDGDNPCVIDRGGVNHKVIDKWRHKKYDVGFILISDSIPFIKLGDTPKLIDDVYLVGNSIGTTIRFNVTKGIVSKTNITLNPWKDIILADFAAYAGESGGPVFGNNSKLVAIWVGYIQIRGTSHECLSFCEPISHIKEALKEYDKNAIP